MHTLSLPTGGTMPAFGLGTWYLGDSAAERRADVAAVREAIHQVYYSLGERGPAHSLLPWQRAHGMPLMAYSPLDQGDLASEPELIALARRLGVTPAQFGLAWLLVQDGVAAIPKARQSAHLRENLAAASLALDQATLDELNRLFPPPRSKPPLAVI